MARQAKAKSDANYNFFDNIPYRLKEGALILGFAVAIFLLLALATYHQSDPGWSVSGSGSEVANAGGRVGAWFSDFFLYIFGYMAYIFPVMFAYSAWTLFSEKTAAGETNFQLFAIRCIGFVLTFIAATGLASLHLPNVHYHLPFTAGGLLGTLVGNLFGQVLNLTGSTLILTALLLCGTTLFSGVSWFKVGRLAFVGFMEVCYVLKNKTLDLFIQAKQRLQERPKRLPKPNIVQPVETAAKPRTKPKKAKQPKSQAVVTTLEPAVPAPDSAKQFKAPKDSRLPPVSLLEENDRSTSKGFSKGALEALSREVEQHLADFGVEAQVVAVHPGPVITRFELVPAPGVKVSKISGLAKDLARALSTTSVRIVEVIPGKAVVGLEVPNESREIVRLREIFESSQYQQANSPLSLALGKDIAGHPVIVDLSKMPHLLVAGTTGSGKSVGLNAMLLSILYKASPQQVRLIMVDPKMLELAIYEGIPHLLAPVVTDMKEAANALRWCVAEMERRYRLMASLGVRNLAGYNKKVQDAINQGKPIPDPFQAKDIDNPLTLEPLPFIVVLIDEFADMMMVVGKKVEQLIARIAQKARAAGIHLLLATQRPSVDVITGLIKANIPTRIAFQVSSKIDSRTIIDQQGAENLLGHGDMLYLPPGTGIPVRVHGAFVADQEVHNVVNELKKQGEPVYIEEITQESSAATEGLVIPGEESDDGENDALYDLAVEFVTQSRKASTSSLQRRFKIGYNRAARIIDEMESAGVVSPMEANGSREVLAPPPPKD